MDNIDGVSQINDNVVVDEEILNTLNSYDELEQQYNELLAAAEALEQHADKDAPLGSEEYAAYLSAVEAHNNAVDSFNAQVTAYNDAVEAYNDAVNGYNSTQQDTSSSSTGDATGTGTADWGNINITNKTFSHIHVKYQAAASKTVTTDDSGVPVYSDSVTDFEVTGVYPDEASTGYGVTYDNDGPNGTQASGTVSMYEDTANGEFGASTNMWGSNVAIDPEDGTISFYVTLVDSDGQNYAINVNLDDSSTFAAGSYYKANTSTDRRGNLTFNDTMASYVDSSGNALERVEIDGEWYYDISGQSVFVISALTCEGTSVRNGNINISSMSGLDLVLNLQTMIEIHQADNADTVNYMNYGLGKLAATPEDPGQPTTVVPDTPTEPTEPTPPDPVGDPGDAPIFNEVEPTPPDPVDVPDNEPVAPDAPSAPDFVGEPGDEPVAPDAPSAPDFVGEPGDEPTAPTAPAAPDFVGEPGDEPTAPTAPAAPDFVDEPGDEPTAPTAPTAPDFVGEPGDEPTAPTAPTAPDFVDEPGDEPTAPPAPTAPDFVGEPGDEPTAPTAPTAPDFVDQPGDEPVAPDFDGTEPEAPTALPGMDHVEKLEELDKKVIIEIDPPADPDPVEPPYYPPYYPPAPTGGDDLVDIPDEDVPLAAVPVTGDSTALFGVMSALSGFGLFLSRKKKGEDETQNE